MLQIAAVFPFIFDDLSYLPIPALFPKTVVVFYALIVRTNCMLGVIPITISSTRLNWKVFSLEVLILLIWTNVPRTNVVVTVVICCICSQDPLFKV